MEANGFSASDLETMLRQQKEKEKAQAKAKAKADKKAERDEEKMTQEELHADCKKRYFGVDMKEGFDHPKADLGEKDGEVFIKLNINNYSYIIQYLHPDIKRSSLDELVFIDGNKITPEKQLDIRSELIHFLHGTNLLDRDVGDAIDLAAQGTEWNRVKEYLDKLNPNNKDTHHLDDWLIKICGAKDTKINRIIGKKFLMAACARGCVPGSYVEGVLIFVGGQGAAKSKLMQELVPENDMYVSDQVELNNTQKATQTMIGKFMSELGELSQMNKINIEDVKEIVIRTRDTYVPKYSNRPKERLRHCLFVGSSNDMNILVDTSGNRRFWCVEVANQFDIIKFMQIKEELWYEAYQAYQECLINRDANEFRDPWVLTPEERKMLDDSNKIFEAEDSLVGFLDDELEKYYHYKTDKTITKRDNKNNEVKTVYEWIDFHKIMELARMHDRSTTDKRLARLLVNSLKMEKNPSSERKSQYRLRGSL